MFAAEIRRKRAACGRTRIWGWHLDEVCVQHQLLRAMDAEREVVECSVTKERDKAAALNGIRKVLRCNGSRKAVITDGLRSHKAALKDLHINNRQDVGRWANYRVENNHLPFGRRERTMTRVPRTHTLQKFSAVHASFHNRIDLMVWTTST